jgi:ribosomal-protein-alanine N-acetyltransferase
MIRAATPADRDAIAALQAATLTDPWPEILSLAVAEDGPLCLVAERRERVVGYAIVVVSADGYLAELAVAPDWRREGVGRALVDACCDRLRERGCDRLHLTARADDDRALAFYEACGFERDERLPGHYLDGAVDGVALSTAL